MNRQAFLQTWWNELRKEAPLKPGEVHHYEVFENSPTVRSCLTALKMNRDGTVQHINLIESDLRGALDLHSLGQLPRDLISNAVSNLEKLRKVVME